MSDRRFRRAAHIFHRHDHQTWHLSLLTSGLNTARRLSTPSLGSGPILETMTVRTLVGGTQRVALDGVNFPDDSSNTVADNPLDQRMIQGVYTGQPAGKWPALVNLGHQARVPTMAPSYRSPGAIRATLEGVVGRRFFATLTTRRCIDATDGTCGALGPIAYAENPPYTARRGAPTPPPPRYTTRATARPLRRTAAGVLIGRPTYFGTA